MRRTRGLVAWLMAAPVAIALLGAACASSAPSEVLATNRRYSEVIELPAPQIAGEVPLEQALVRRRSQRRYTAEELDLATLGQLMWAGQGITDDSGHRTAPSAGARYPLELYALTTTDLMHYLPVGHRVEQRSDSSTLPQLADAAFGQTFLGSAPSVVVITGVVARTELEYGRVAGDLMNREAGHAAQNILLQATALGLAAVPVGGFDPSMVARLLALPPGEEVLYLLPVGYPSPSSG